MPRGIEVVITLISKRKEGRSMKKKFIASLLVVAMVAGSLVGCGKKEDSGKGGKKNETLVISSEDFSNKFSPYFSESSADMNIVSLTQIGLFPLDREGNTLLNASKATNFVFEVDGISDSLAKEINSINSREKILIICPIHGPF